MAHSQYRGCIYLATNAANNSIYIGKTLMGLHRRRKTHFAAVRRGEMQPFICALRKHGEQAFVWRELFLSDDHSALMSAEIELIACYKRQGRRMYNATSGGDGASRKRSEAERERMRNRKVSEETKERLRQSWTPERKAALAESKRGSTLSQESRAKLSEARKGMKFTPEHCEAIRLSKLGNTCRLGTGRRGRLVKA